MVDIISHLARIGTFSLNRLFTKPVPKNAGSYFYSDLTASTQGRCNP
jgi:hypothetical protein